MLNFYKTLSHFRCLVHTLNLGVQDIPKFVCFKNPDSNEKVEENNDLIFYNVQDGYNEDEWDKMKLIKYFPESELFAGKKENPEVSALN